MSVRPGLVILFGSGETSPSGRKVHDWLMRQLAPQQGWVNRPIAF